ncbi:hypothetical protein [Bacillus thuringiensis]|uniref:Uncharacterized protein n=1 Tax=Bacillus thuringiensis TaxID=1428 RepID=A0A9W3V801_BACTU|nr:hypothetical protein [Bacillus thuringiensis]AMR02306.1 hypothetical protein AXW78_09145 [Bacillus thuringiensis]AYF80078.1 hypothetical protein D7J84_02185 [Bacillus thuringiensis]PNK34886.1 hypothetical protein CBR55_27835 [Bacillus thuringiensis]
MNYYVPYYPAIYPYQAPQYEHRSPYPVNTYYAYPVYYNNHFYTVPTYPVNKENDYLNPDYHSVRQDTIKFPITVTFQNMGNSPYRGYYLDVDGNTGKVILTKPHQAASGILWKLTYDENRGSFTIQNMGNSPYRGYYLNVDGNTGKVILTHIPTSSSIEWGLPVSGNNARIQNKGNSPYRAYYLDIDGNTGKVILTNPHQAHQAPHAASGILWRLTESRSE